MASLWKITGIGPHGRSFVVLIRAKDYGAALERFTFKYRQARVLSVVKQEG